MIMSLTNHEMQSAVKEIVVLSFRHGEPPTFEGKDACLAAFRQGLNRRVFP
jgi:hypothetical protein